MPWELKDVERHNKGLSAREKRQWCHVANGALEAGDDDGTAITKANGVVKKGRIEFHVNEGCNDDASTMAHAASDHADKTNKYADHNMAYSLHRIAAQLHRDDGNENQALKHRQMAQSHALTADSLSAGKVLPKEKAAWEKKRWEKDIEEMLYQKATALVEHVRLQVVSDIFESTILNEADPKPRVEVDHMGKPVIPNRQQYLMYFQDMQAGHVKQAVEDAHQRWAAAEQTALAARQAALASKSKTAQDHAALTAAHLKALGAEISVANMVLKQKQNKEMKTVKTGNQKIKKQTSAANKMVNTITKKQSPMMKMLAKHAVNAFMPKQTAIHKPKNFLTTPKVTPRST